jgi:hypothetical protein
VSEIAKQQSENTYLKKKEKKRREGERKRGREEERKIRPESVVILYSTA